jgi:holliday junction DNA helicase RuvA
MYDYIRGVLAETASGEAVVEAGGVGFQLVIPLSTFERLPQAGAEVKLYTHHYVREDAEKLYGFLSRLEREIFRQLIAISNIGPKTAISVLSGLSPQELVSCVNKGDASRLRKVQGVGDKTAQRLIVELKGKLAAVAEDQDGGEGAPGSAARRNTEQ